MSLLRYDTYQKSNITLPSVSNFWYYFGKITHTYHKWNGIREFYDKRNFNKRKNIFLKLV